MSNLGLAISIAAQAFENDTDKGGQPYILHCLRVMRGVDSKDEELMIIAVLHDLVEDKSPFWNITKLQSLGFSDRVIQALIRLTHLGNEPYEYYIEGIAENRDAILVKLQDLKDNSNISRLKGLKQSDFERMKKYHHAYTYLSSFL
jgi:(p)ppGpp synthase/HD superfamily hydrolase